MQKRLDIGSLSIIIITFALFLIALWTKGFTHDLLLEAGVFLVSVKLIIMATKNRTYAKEIQHELAIIKKILQKK